MTSIHVGVPGILPLIGILADPHIGQLQSEHMIRTCLDWMVGRGVAAVLVAGDLNERPDEIGFLQWARSPQGGGLPPNVQIVPCIGNWDAEVAPGMYDQTSPWPHATIQSRYDALFQGREWFRLSIGGLSVFSLNNLTDYVMDTGATAYANCNPPGARTVCNPDHSGITVTGSEQRVWLDEQSDVVRKVPWKIAMMHRPPWSNHDEDPRRMHRGCREALAHAIDCGLSLVISGDQHVGCLAGPFYPPEELVTPGGVGTYCLVLMGGFQCRGVDDTLLPRGSILWSRGSTSGEDLCEAATLELYQEQAVVTIFEVAPADLMGSVVFETTLARNPGR